MIHSESPTTRPLRWVDAHATPSCFVWKHLPRLPFGEPSYPPREETPSGEAGKGRSGRPHPSSPPGSSVWEPPSYLISSQIHLESFGASTSRRRGPRPLGNPPHEHNDTCMNIRILACFRNGCGIVPESTVVGSGIEMENCGTRELHRCP